MADDANEQQAGEAATGYRQLDSPGSVGEWQLGQPGAPAAVWTVPDG